MKTLLDKIFDHYKSLDFDRAAWHLEMDYGYAEQEMQWTGEPCAMPTDFAIKCEAVVRELFVAPYYLARQHYCKHKNWIDESYGGPDSGCIAGQCPDCGWSFHVTMY